MARRGRTWRRLENRHACYPRSDCYRIDGQGEFAWLTIPRPTGNRLPRSRSSRPSSTANLADGQEHPASLLSVRDRPYVLEDATVERSIQLHAEQQDFLGVFAEPLTRWRNEHPSDAQRRELDRLEG